LADLSRAGIRLKGFCRTNLFKRLESSGHAFILSLQRHVLRNFIYLHAIENDLPLPIGTQDMGLLDTTANDEDSTLWEPAADGEDGADDDPAGQMAGALTETDYKQRAADVYARYSSQFRNRFRWLASALFEAALAIDLRADAQALMDVLADSGAWDPARDAKLHALVELLADRHPQEKVLIFSQFADTVDFLEAELQSRDITRVAGVTGANADPTAVAHRFSPVSNEKREAIPAEQELRVVIATDVLSEGQNLQDCAIIVNYDLPWAIIRLIQRAGRVDRIGQKAETLQCYSFLPADGVDRIINLRGRVRDRLRQNAEVVGTDEAFFDDEDKTGLPLFDLYHEKAGILDGEDDTEVDLASYAYQIWKNAIDADPPLEKTIMTMPNVVYSTRAHQPNAYEPEGALVYLKTGDAHDALAWVNSKGESVTESQFTILNAAQCEPDTPPIARHENHHELVAKGVKLIVETERSVGGQLGRPSGARFRTYERLKRFAAELKDTLFVNAELNRALDDIYKYPLLQSAIDTLNRQLKSGVSDDDLAELVINLRKDARLCRVSEEVEIDEPQVICSLGLKAP
jgi:hypothetical protein